MCVVGLVGVMALHSCDAHCLHWHLRLEYSAANVVGLLLDSVMVAMLGTLIGLSVGISVGTIGISACGCMERVSSVVIGMGYGSACWCLQPWNSLCVVKMVWGNGFIKLVGICLYASLCCINDTS
jgi:hypothetical protein